MDYFLEKGGIDMEVWTGWLIFAGLCFVAEFMTEVFLIAWFGVGALAAMGISFVTNNFIIQLAVFAVISLILLLSTKKFRDKVRFQVNSNKCIHDYR